jgi:hypothetical protein
MTNKLLNLQELADLQEYSAKQNTLLLKLMFENESLKEEISHLKSLLESLNVKEVKPRTTSSSRSSRLFNK